MAPKKVPIWCDRTLLVEVSTAKRFIYAVFGLHHKSEHSQWETVIKKLASRCLSDADRQRVEELTKSEGGQFPLELWEELKEGRLPPALHELEDRLYLDFKECVEKRVATQIKACDPVDRQGVVRTILHHLNWEAMHYSDKWLRLMKAGGTWLPRLEKSADCLIRFNATPDPLFAGFAYLETIGQISDDFLRKQLGLTQPAKNLPETVIESTRKSKELAWPPELLDLMRRLEDNTQVKDLHERLRNHIRFKIAKRIQRGERRVAQENEKGALEMKAFFYAITGRFYLIIKCATEWFQTKRPGSTTWAQHVLNNLSAAAKRALSAALDEPIGGRPDHQAQTTVAEPGKGTTNRDDIERLLEQICALTEPGRSIVAMRHGMDLQTREVDKREMSITQIATALGKSPDLVKKYYLEAVELLRQAE